MPLEEKKWRARYADGYEWANHRGQVFVQVHDHPHHRADGFVARSRLIMEELEGRYLEPEERVWHKDEDVSNDDPENLVLFPNQKAVAQHISKLKKEANKQLDKDSYEGMQRRARELREARQAAAQKGADIAAENRRQRKREAEAQAK